MPWYVCKTVLMPPTGPGGVPGGPHAFIGLTHLWGGPVLPNPNAMCAVVYDENWWVFGLQPAVPPAPIACP
jgi:hypothetical protein